MAKQFLTGRTMKVELICWFLSRHLNSIFEDSGAYEIIIIIIARWQNFEKNIRGLWRPTRHYAQLFSLPV